jgi:hypothetical protein
MQYCKTFRVKIVYYLNNTRFLEYIIMIMRYYLISICYINVCTYGITCHIKTKHRYLYTALLQKNITAPMIIVIKNY